MSLATTLDPLVQRLADASQTPWGLRMDPEECRRWARVLDLAMAAEAMPAPPPVVVPLSAWRKA